MSAPVKLSSQPAYKPLGNSELVARLASRRRAICCTVFLVLILGIAVLFAVSNAAAGTQERTEAETKGLKALNPPLTEQYDDIDTINSEEYSSQESYDDEESAQSSEDEDEGGESEVSGSPQKKSGPWFIMDPPGMDPVTKNRLSIWEYEISLKVNASRTDKQRRSPRLVFIKGLKVGGTSVAVALDHVARSYDIGLQDRMSEAKNRQYEPDYPRCNSNGSLWFHHGYLNEWMRKCVSRARFITLLRSPISQVLSWETMGVSARYYSHYPAKPCNVTRHIDVIVGRTPDYLRHLLKEIEHCVDTPYRKNITLQLVAHAITGFKNGVGGAFGVPGVAVLLTAEWITGNTLTYRHMTGDKIFRYLRENYFLVGITERLNEFLMLIALHMGWDPAQLYYDRCKPTNTDVHPDEFAQYYPQLMAKLEKATTPMREAYELVKKDFDDHVKALGGWFQDIVRDFEKGLRIYQQARRSPVRPYLWEMYYYKDHHSETC